MPNKLNNKRLILVFIIFCPFIFSEKNMNLFEGHWQTSSSIVLVKQCNRELCAFIEKITTEDKDNFKQILDVNNRNKSLRQRPLVGINLLQDFSYPDKNIKMLRNGKIYDPGRGRIFKSNLYILDNGNLKVEGCFLRICGHEEWSRLK
tara:strand:- start:2836 stop:3279 length:444 start_codon:yes stop_codon:yes gene_type:complete